MVKRQFTKYNKFMNTKPVILFIQDKRTLHVQGLIGSEVMGETKESQDASWERNGMAGSSHTTEGTSRINGNAVRMEKNIWEWSRPFWNVARADVCKHQHVLSHNCSLLQSDDLHISPKHLNLVQFMAAAASPRVINRSFPNILSQVSGGGRVVTEQDYKQSRLMSTKLELSQRVTAPVNA